jgi:hypothetical protein
MPINVALLWQLFHEPSKLTSKLKHYLQYMEKKVVFGGVASTNVYIYYLFRPCGLSSAEAQKLETDQETLLLKVTVL